MEETGLAFAELIGATIAIAVLGLRESSVIHRINWRSQPRLNVV